MSESKKMSLAEFVGVEEGQVFYFEHEKTKRLHYKIENDRLYFEGSTEWIHSNKSVNDFMGKKVILVNPYDEETIEDAKAAIRLGFVEAFNGEGYCVANTLKDRHGNICKISNGTFKSLPTIQWVKLANIVRGE